MGIRSTLIAAPPTAAHAAAAQKSGFNANGLTTALAEQIGEVSFLLREIIKTLPTVSLTAAGTFSTASPNIAVTSIIPATVVSGMAVTDVTAGHLLGVVSSGAGTTTLVLAANSAFGGTGSSIRLDDANLATYSAQLAALQ